MGYISHTWEQEFQMSLVPHDDFSVHTSLSYDKSRASQNSISTLESHNDGCVFVFQKMYGILICINFGSDFCCRGISMANSRASSKSPFKPALVCASSFKLSLVDFLLFCLV